MRIRILIFAISLALLLCAFITAYFLNNNPKVSNEETIGWLLSYSIPATYWATLISFHPFNKQKSNKFNFIIITSFSTVLFTHPLFLLLLFTGVFHAYADEHVKILAPAHLLILLPLLLLFPKTSSILKCIFLYFLAYLGHLIFAFCLSANFGFTVD